jgi:hypothetical protein
MVLLIGQAALYFVKLSLVELSQSTLFILLPLFYVFVRPSLMCCKTVFAPQWTRGIEKGTSSS